MKPSIGRIVHYVAFGNEPCAAIITAVGSHDRVSLTVFQSLENPLAVAGIPHESNAVANNYDFFWRWPPRVE